MYQPTFSRCTFSFGIHIGVFKSNITYAIVNITITVYSVYTIYKPLFTYTLCSFLTMLLLKTFNFLFFILFQHVSINKLLNILYFICCLTTFNSISLIISCCVNTSFLFFSKRYVLKKNTYFFNVTIIIFILCL
jgi:hypothetical protein